MLGWIVVRSIGRKENWRDPLERLAGSEQATRRDLCTFTCTQLCTSTCTPTHGRY
jgi:hypothetical protein